ncbi:MAG: hypothetical protein M3250_03105 [Thermoproteota archaeon]|nr:hypothetical protein [Thermoproteota archaeon]
MKNWLLRYIEALWEKVIVSNSHPMGFAASILYLSSIITKDDDNVTQKWTWLRLQE